MCFTEAEKEKEEMEIDETGLVCFIQTQLCLSWHSDTTLMSHTHTQPLLYSTAPYPVRERQGGNTTHTHTRPETILKTLTHNNKCLQAKAILGSILSTLVLTFEWARKQKEMLVLVSGETLVKIVGEPGEAIIWFLKWLPRLVHQLFL